ncbi:hypothetical protein MNKW57_10510 [Biformimicrobium ophioploci]|uniref:Uncharacterized protein n=1 Tax=Biformimicrobium ophioploci TaxID=3036711 RepID=A0ABQ6LXC2_9GAMM|nr:hypothetical protein MNKW57_10510 [Microbulbifer sp. NKW57]
MQRAFGGYLAVFDESQFLEGNNFVEVRQQHTAPKMMQFCAEVRAAEGQASID